MQKEKEHEIFRVFQVNTTVNKTVNGPNLISYTKSISFIKNRLFAYFNALASVIC